MTLFIFFKTWPWSDTRRLITSFKGGFVYSRNLHILIQNTFFRNTVNTSKDVPNWKGSFDHGKMCLTATFKASPVNLLKLSLEVNSR